MFGLKEGGGTKSYSGRVMISWLSSMSDGWRFEIGLLCKNLAFKSLLSALCPRKLSWKRLERLFSNNSYLAEGWFSQRTCLASHNKEILENKELSYWRMGCTLREEHAPSASGQPPNQISIWAASLHQIQVWNPCCTASASGIHPSCTKFSTYSEKGYWKEFQKKPWSEKKVLICTEEPSQGAWSGDISFSWL